MTFTTALVIWVIGIPVTFVLQALWYRLRRKQASGGDFAMASMYSLLWPGAFPLYWFIQLYCAVMGWITAGACWLWNLIATPRP